MLSKEPQSTGPQRERRKVGEESLATAEIKQTAAAIDDASIELPALDNEDAVWAIVDSGSKPHAASQKNHFPGANVRVSEAQRRGQCYRAADGGELKKVTKAPWLFKTLTLNSKCCQRAASRRNELE